MLIPLPCSLKNNHFKLWPCWTFSVVSWVTVFLTLSHTHTHTYTYTHSQTNHFPLSFGYLQNPWKSQGYTFSSSLLLYSEEVEPLVTVTEAHLTDTQGITGVYWSPGTRKLNDLGEVSCTGNQMPVGSSGSFSSPIIPVTCQVSTWQDFCQIL